MKLRMLDDSLRLRLSRQEVEAVGRGERMVSTAHFPNGTVFSYALGVTAGTGLTAHFENDCIEVLVPMATAAEWARGDDVGIAATQPTAHGALSILIEKDFPCVHMNPHPLERP